MKKTNFSAILVAAITLLCCGTGCKKSSSDYLTLKVRPVDELLKLSDFAEKVEVIKLANDSVLNGIEQLVVDKNGNLLIRDVERCFSLQLYAPDGKLLCQVGKKGRGPGEYFSVDDIDIDSGKIFLDASGVMAYDMEGRYLSDIPKMNTDFHTNFAIKGDTLIKCYGGCYISFDINGQSYREYMKEVDIPGFSTPPTHRNSHLSKNMDDGTVYWERYYNDTIFEAVGGDIKPFLYVDFGDLKLPKDIPIDYMTANNEEAKKYCSDVSNFKISDHIITFMFNYKGVPYTCIYNRDTKKQYVTPNIVKDIGNMCATFPKVYAVQGKKIYFHIDPEGVVQMRNILENTEIKNLDFMKEWSDLVGEANEEDNPYIAVVTCK